MTTQSHSPLPWTVKSGENVIFIYDSREGISSVAHVGKRDMDHDGYANAQLICTSVNAHQSLVEALESALLAIDDLTSKLSTVKSMLPIDHPAQNQAAYDVEAVDGQIRTALLGAEQSSSFP